MNKGEIKKIRFTKNNLTWICINSPDEKTVKYLHKNYKFHHLDLEDCLSESQRPKIDDYEDYLFLVIHAPVRRGRKRYVANSEVNIFIGQNYVITLHDNNPIINEVFERCRKKIKTKEEYMSKGSGYFLYMIIDDIFESNLPLLDDINKQINELEKEVFEQSQGKDKLRDILKVKKDIINFRRIILPERAIIAQLEHKNKKFLPEKLDVYFDEIVDKIEKIFNSLENLHELIISIQETNESLLSHTTNNVIKILTVFSVVMLPLTFITGFYGMNIATLPFASQDNAHFIISGILLGIVVLMVGFFKFKKWI